MRLTLAEDGCLTERPVTYSRSVRVGIEQLKQSTKNANNTRGRKVARADRINEILDASTTIINQSGMSEINLRQIADRLGLTYYALYRYFQGSGDLAKATYIRTYTERERSLERLLNGPGTGCERVLGYIRQELAAPLHSRVKNAYIRTLPQEHLNEVNNARHRQTARLVDLIRMGQTDGSIRPLDVETIAIAIDCIVSWSIKVDLATQMSGTKSAGLIDDAIDVLDRGILQDRQSPPALNRIEGDIIDVIGRRFDRSDKDREWLELLLRTAMAAFNAKGAAATIPDMAQEIGMSKTAYYQLYADKQDLLMHCYLRGIALQEACYGASESRYDHPVTQNMHESLYLHAAHGSPAGPIPCFNALELLKPPQLRMVTYLLNSSRIRGVRRLEIGVRKGQFRALNPSVVLLLTATVRYDLPTWYEESYPLSLEEVALENINLIYQGLSA